MPSQITLQIKFEAQARQVAKLRDRRSMKRPGLAQFQGRRRDSGFLQYAGADGSLSMGRQLANSRPQPLAVPAIAQGWYADNFLQRNA